MSAAESRPALLAMLRAHRGRPVECIDHALGILREELAMDVAFVSSFRDGQRWIIHAVSVDDTAAATIGTNCPAEESLCHLIAHELTPALAPDIANDPVLGSHPHRSLYNLGAYAGVPLRAGSEVVGAVCCVSSQPHASLNVRDEPTLRTVSAYISEILAASSAAEPAADHDAGNGLGAIAGLVATGDSLESLTRPMLEIVRQVTGLESTYLTTIDWAAGTQQVIFANNTGDLAIPENIPFDWQDTLCRRSLDDGILFTNDVPSIWADSLPAQALGIVTYVSVPIRDENDGVVGTLCGASKQPREIDPADLEAMNMFARLLGSELARQSAHDANARRAAELEERTRHLTEMSTRDSLTGARNRAGVLAWLDLVIRDLRPDLEQLAVAFLDIDRFKFVNDTHGHAVGDAVLRELSTSLLTVGRPNDLVGRLGGDEFVVAAVLPARPATYGGWVARVRKASTVTVDSFTVTASVGTLSTTDPAITAAEALHMADEAMYDAKRRRADNVPTG